MFKSWKKSQKQETPLELAKGQRDRILQAAGLRSLPSMPGTAHRSFTLCLDLDADDADFIELIKADEGLSARIIKLANSVFFDRGQKASSIEEAVLVIGLNELRPILNATCLSELFPTQHPLRAVLWSHNLATALLSKRLAEEFFHIPSDQAFLVGLMHDIGKLFLLYTAADLYEQVFKTVEEEYIGFVEAESLVLGFTHAEAGMVVAEAWHFSADLTAAVGGHHLSWEAIATNPLIQTVKCADTLSYLVSPPEWRGVVALRKQSERELEQAAAALGLGAEIKPLLHDLKLFIQQELHALSGNA